MVFLVLNVIENIDHECIISYMVSLQKEDI